MINQQEDSMKTQINKQIAISEILEIAISKLETGYPHSATSILYKLLEETNTMNFGSVETLSLIIRNNYK
jgi:hypothetical protein